MDGAATEVHVVRRVRVMLPRLQMIRLLAVDVSQLQVREDVKAVVHLFAGPYTSPLISST